MDRKESIHMAALHFGCTAPENIPAADTIWLVGENLSHTRQAALLDEAKEAATLLKVDPFGPGEACAGIRVIATQPRHCGGLALVKAVAKRIVELDDLALTAGRPRFLDTDFISHHTLGFYEFARDLRNENWYILIEESGVDLDQIERITRNVLVGKTVVACWDSRCSQEIVQLLKCVMMMRGQITIPDGRLHFSVHGIDRNTSVHRARRIYGKRLLSMIPGTHMPGGPGEALINLADIEMLGFKPGDLVDITTVTEDASEHRIEGFRLVPSEIPRGCISTQDAETITPVLIQASA